MNIEDHKNLIKKDEYWWSSVDEYGYAEIRRFHAVQKDIIKKYLHRNKVAIQAGGHCGFVPKQLSHEFEYVYTFEPNTDMFIALCLNISEKNVFKIQACLGKEHKPVAMESYCGQPAGADFVRGNGNIPTFLIDDLNIQCDLIMLDTEGSELDILIGSEKTIAQYKPVLCIERYWGIRTTGNQNYEHELDNFLNKYNYKLVESRINGSEDWIYI